jgi:hypothetical protein
VTAAKYIAGKNITYTRMGVIRVIVCITN